MTRENYLLHGTRELSAEPVIDRNIDTAPPAYLQLPVEVDARDTQPLTLHIEDYNILRANKKEFALGRLATRMINTFFISDPKRDSTLTSVDIRQLWKQYHIDNVDMKQAEPALRGIDALNAIRERIDGQPFVTGAYSGSGKIARLAIAPDIKFTDLRHNRNSLY